MTRGSDIERLARFGAKVRARLLDVRRADATAERPRVAIVVAKFGKTAVARNKLKRQLRELVRLMVLPELPPMDLLVRARREAYDAPFETLKDDMDSVCRRLGSRGDA